MHSNQLIGQALDYINYPFNKSLDLTTKIFDKKMK